VGLGFRLSLAGDMLREERSEADFIEIAPENYLGVGGLRARHLESAAERWPVVAHGLCGDFSGSAPLDRELLGELKGFLKGLGCRWYSDHMCFTHVAGAEVHDLIPLPYNGDAIERAAARIRDVRDLLDMPLAIENVSAYVRMPGGEMDEATFMREVAEAADCKLLLDVNNVWVNSQNFGFDPRAFIDTLPLERVVQMHIAGHDVEDDGLLIDTHGQPICDPVYELFAYTLEKMPHEAPVLLERDHNFPPLEELEAELSQLKKIQEASRG
jgi:uncharacterized protein (UPF0276 family)